MHQASKNSKFIRISQSGLKKLQFYLFTENYVLNQQKKHLCSDTHDASAPLGDEYSHGVHITLVI